MSEWFWLGPTLAALLTFLGYSAFKWFQGEFNPGLTLEYRHKRVSFSFKQSLVFVEVEACNTSRVPVKVRHMEVTLRRLARYTDEEVHNLSLASAPPGSSFYEPINWEHIFTIVRPWEPGQCTVQPSERHHESFEFVIPGSYDTNPLQMDIQHVNKPLSGEMTFDEPVTAWRRIRIIEPDHRDGEP
ncbi:MAG: hypothetical protein F4X65_06530 [Chloroflexi bacterium]|nr:hypothetical protein [Chloroflexota bacterium]